MSYKSLSFYIFFVVLTLLYQLFPAKRRWMLLLAGSVVFYLFAGWDEFLMVVVTSLIVYVAARLMDGMYRRFEEEAKASRLAGKEKMKLQMQYKRRCKRVLIPALVGIVGALAACKYAGRLLTAVLPLAEDGTFELLVPLGISYYTFSAVGYLLDVYWKKTQAQRNYAKVLLCMIYFPQVVQGPIARFQRLLPQFENPVPLTYERLCYGLQGMLWGYFKKLVIADRLSIVVNTVYGDLSLYRGFYIPMAAVLGVFWLYADFSGCMDIVTGASYILGVDLEKNFDHPFFCRSVAEFWRRWHITLGAWFKDYVYFPLATSQGLMKLAKRVKGKWGAQAGKNISVIIPLAIVWLLTGIWHGTGWNYVLWGVYYGVLIIASTVASGAYRRLAEKCHVDTATPAFARFQMIRTFLLFAGGRMLTLPESLVMIRHEIRSCFVWNPWIFFDGSLYTLGLDRPNFLLALGLIVLLMAVEKQQLKGSIRRRIAEKPLIVRWALYYAAILAVLVLGIYGDAYSASDFIYGNF